VNPETEKVKADAIEADVRIMMMDPSELDPVGREF
jgi:hypothetical protein